MFIPLNFLLFFLLINFYSISHLKSSETLGSVLVDAYNYYPDIKKSKFDLEASKKDLNISKTDFLPSIDLTLSQGKQITKSNPDTSNYNYTTLNPSSLDLALSQPLGATKYLNLKSAKNNFLVSEFKNESLIQDILYKATKNYYNFLKERFLLDVAIKNEENLIQKFEATEKRFSFRDVTKTDVFQAKARLAEATSKRLEAENNLEIAKSDFRSIVGRDPMINWYDSKNKTKVIGSNPKDWSKFVTMPKLPPTLSNALEIALKNNPELNQIKLELENSKINIQKNGLNFLPELSITGTYGKSLESTRSINRKESYEITADLSVPLFNKGHNIFNLNKSRVQAFSTQNSLKTKEISLRHEVKSTWNKIQSLISSIKSLEVSVESNEVALEGVIKEAGVGTQTTLNILDAQKELTEAEANLVNAQYNLIESSYKLLQSCGLMNFNYLQIR